MATKPPRFDDKGYWMILCYFHSLSDVVYLFIHLTTPWVPTATLGVSHKYWMVNVVVS